MAGIKPRKENKQKMHDDTFPDDPQEVGMGWKHGVTVALLAIVSLVIFAAGHHARQEYRHYGGDRASVRWNLGPFEYVIYNKADNGETVERRYFGIIQERIIVTKNPGLNLELVEHCTATIVVIVNKCKFDIGRSSISQPRLPRPLIDPGDLWPDSTPPLLKRGRELAEKIPI